MTGKLVSMVAASAAMCAGVVPVPGSPLRVQAPSAHIAAWRIAGILRHCRGLDSLSSVTATGPGDAWALGQPGEDGQGCGADVEHWDGNRWRRVLVAYNG